MWFGAALLVILAVTACNGSSSATPTSTPEQGAATATPTSTPEQGAASATPTSTPEQDEASSTVTSSQPQPTDTTTAIPRPGIPVDETATVRGTGSCLNVRAAPSTDARILGCHADGTKLPVRGGYRATFGEDWVAVTTADNENGWATGRFLDVDWRAVNVDYNLPVHQQNTRTGIPIIDGAIAAVHRGDHETLVQNIHPTEIECVAVQQGIGSPPLCEPGEPPGTVIEVLPSSQCEGHYARLDGYDGHGLVSKAPRIYAVYETGEQPGGGLFPAGDYGLLFALGNGLSRQLFVSSDGLVQMSDGCADAASARVPAGAVFVLPPQE